MISLQNTIINPDNNHRIPTITDQQAHLAHLRQQLPSRKQEVWSTARKLNHDYTAASDLKEPRQPRRLTDMHSKYLQLNNNMLNFKLHQQVVNPINHQVTFQGRDLIDRNQRLSMFASQDELQHKSSFDLLQRPPAQT